MAKAMILVVEDSAADWTVVKGVLEADHYAVTWAKTGLEARSLLDKCRPDLVVLDRHLPDMDGAEFCAELRAEPRHASLPVLFLTARKSVTDKVVGLKTGGDDYLAKPFSGEELVARVEALLRRTLSRGASPSALKDGPIELNAETRLVRISGKEIPLTTKEFDLLQAFMERPERVLSRAFLLSNVWGYGPEVEIDTKAVDVMVMGLRRKLGKLSASVEAVRNVGFRWRPPR
jgi:DNA-binding response OmpR family regulator